MSGAAQTADSIAPGDDRHREATGQGEGGPASKRITLGYGFWIFLLADIVMFSAFFASYVVLKDETAGGPGARQLFDLNEVAVETGCLLLSSFTCGLASIATSKRSALGVQIALLITGLLGTAFLALELKEFAHLLITGAGPQRSAFLSAFFTLVGCHGAHIVIGLMWLSTMMAQLWVKGFREDIIRWLMCFSLFWHALDIVWIGIFTVVYLIGVAT